MGKKAEREKEVTFYLEHPSRKKSRIIMQYYFRNKEIDFASKKEKNTPLKYPTGVSVDPKYWDNENQKIVPGHTGYKDDNLKLTELEKLISSIYDNLGYNNKEISLVTLREELDLKTGRKEEVKINSSITKFIEGYIEEAKGDTDNFKEKTITSYNNFVNKLKEFEEKKKITLTFNALDSKTLTDFFKFITNYIVDEKSGDTMAKNTIWKYKKHFRKFLNLATASGIKIKFDYKDKKFSPTDEEVNHIYLDFEEIDKLLAVDLSQRPYYDRVRDVWVMDSYLGGLRYSDLGRNFEPKRMKLKNGEVIEYLELRTIKTGEWVQIPLLKPVKEIYKKYQGEFPKTISNQPFNRVIKEVAKMAGLDEPVELSRTRKGEIINEKLEKWQLVTVHTARRSFATNFYLLGVPVKTLMKITGHTTEKAFMKYIKAGLKDHLELFYTIVSSKLPDRFIIAA